MAAAELRGDTGRSESAIDGQHKMGAWCGRGASRLCAANGVTIRTALIDCVTLRITHAIRLSKPYNLQLIKLRKQSNMLIANDSQVPWCKDFLLNKTQNE